MKIPTSFVCSALFVAVLPFTGCVDPYYAGAPAAVPVYRPGYTINTLPHGYRSEVIGGSDYYHHDNVYYRRQGRGYVVVEAPRPRYRDRDGRTDWNDPRPNVPGGRVVRRLPNGHVVVNHGGGRYYRADDVYYQSRGDGYVVVRSPY